MPTIITRTWTARGANGRRTRRIAFGYDMKLPDGRRERKIASEWATEEAAQIALADRLKALAQQDDDQPPAPSPGVQRPPVAGITLGQARERYLATKTSEHKQTRDDRHHLDRMIPFFGGPDTPLAAITAARIAEYRVWRANQMSKRRGDGTLRVSPATVNRELATIRHLLFLAVKEWEILDRVPVVRTMREPEGRVRWLNQHRPDEEERLLAECRASKNPHLAGLVTVALETGMRQGEVLGLTWERVDFSRGVIQLEKTKSNRRREIPMRQAVYDVLAPMRAAAREASGGRSEPRGRVWPYRRFPNAAWEAAMDRAGVEGFRFHDCRHHFASTFMMRGGSVLALQKILGHRLLRMTERYAHLSPDHLRNEMERTAAPAAPSPAPVAQSVAQNGAEAGAQPVSARDTGQARQPLI
jgi:integrase